MADASARFPTTVDVGDGSQKIAIEAFVAAPFHNEFLDGLVGKTHRRANLALDLDRRAELSHRPALARASLQILDRPCLAEPAAENLDVADQRLVTPLLRAGHQVGEGSPNKFLLRPALDGLEAR